MSVFKELEHRRKCQTEEWNTQLLYKFSEEQCVKKLDCNEGIWKQVVAGKKSTMAIAFSSDGKYMASGHLTHEIAICLMVPKICHIRTLAGHSRTPWCLSFDPWQPHILYSGCLAGTVHKWDIRSRKPNPTVDVLQYQHPALLNRSLTGTCSDNSFNPGISSPVNSIVFIPSESSLLLVALERWLFLLSSTDFQVVWRTQTATPSTKVKLVLHHPCENIMLIALTNPPDQGSMLYPPHIRTILSTRTTHRLQIYGVHKEHPPDLDNSSNGLINISARIYGPRSCALTEHYVACFGIGDQGRPSIKLYSTKRGNFGHINVVSLDLSPCNRHLLLGITSRKDVYHMDRVSVHTILAEIYRIESSSSGATLLKQVCVARSAQGQSSNVATWVPLVCNHGTGITLGTQKGSLYYWGLDNRDNCFSKSTVNFHERSHIPAYPQVPIPPIQMRPTTNSDQ